MTAISNSPSPFTSPTAERETAFNYRHCWYPVIFLQDLIENPYRFSLYDEPLVLFRDGKGKLGCLVDRCSHRCAKLSDGQVIEGKLECLYHGWQFDTTGQCVHIPQLPSNSPIPRNACIQSYPVAERQEVIWIWLGEAELANQEDIPIIADLERPGCAHSDYLIDFPYEHTFLMENLIDPAHVNISHDRSEFGALRENAQPLAMEVSEISIRGIKAKWRNTRNPNEPWKPITFIAPNLVHYQFALPNPDWCAGLALYGISLGKGRSRLLVRRYQNFKIDARVYRWRWLEHLRQSRILEDDLPLIVGQQQLTGQLGQSLKNLYLPLKTSDLLVVEYLKWLDTYGQSLPYYQGYTTARNTHLENSKSVPNDRYNRHTLNCSTCSRVHRSLIQLKQISIGIAIVLAALAIILPHSVAETITVVGALLAVGMAVFANWSKTRYEQTYDKQKAAYILKS